jgi:DNA-binding IclR family transcriptional regulator
VILAWVDDPLPYLDDVGPRQRPTWLRQLAQIRDEGYAVSREELIRGAVAIAVPVFLGGGKVAGSLAVYGPSVRIDEPQIRRIARLLMRQSQRISLKAGAA